MSSTTRRAIVPNLYADNVSPAVSSQTLKRWRVISVVVAVVCSAIAGAGQVLLPEAMFSLGHSLTLWLLLGIFATRVGNFKQALFTVAISLVCSVIAFFLAWSVTATHLVGVFNLTLVLLWIAAAPIAGALLAGVSVCLRASPFASAAATGFIAGFVIGDVAVTRHGSNVITGWHYAFMHVDVLVVLAVLAVIAVISWQVRRSLVLERRFSTLLSGLLIGGVLGWVMSFAPVFFHSIIDHLRFLW